MSFNPVTESNRIIDFIKITFEQTQKATAVIGLSGGIDSAVSFALTARSIGADHIQAFHLPSKTTNPEHLKDIQALISNTKFPISNFHNIPIYSIIQKSWRIIKHHSPLAADDTFKATNRLRLANLAARIRMMLLFDAAKKYDALVIGTENRSESMLGYFTRFGDSASDLEPIAHLFKTQVIEMAQYLEIPEAFIKKSPSADLWPGQTDETELGFSYAEADPILMQLDQGQTPIEPLAEKIIAAVNRNKFKHQVPYVIPHSRPLP